jgi:Tfp pilus assembly protein PilW
MHLRKCSRNKAKNRKGTTLVELLIYMALLAILLVTLTDMLVAILNIKVESEATSNVEQDGRYVIERLVYDIRKADAINSPSLGGTSSSLSITVDGGTYSYAVSGDYLQLANTYGTNNLNGNTSVISNTSFKRLGNSVKLQFDVSSFNDQKTFSTTVSLR